MLWFVRVCVCFLLVGLGGLGQAFAAKCDAFNLNWPQVGLVTVSVCSGKLHIISSGRVVFNSSTLDDGDLWVSVEKLGRLRFDKNRNALVLPFTAVEGAPEYEGNAKGDLYFNGKKWLAECASKTCEVLATPKQPKSTSTTIPKIDKCKVLKGAYRTSPKQRYPTEVNAVGCKNTGSLHLIIGNRVLDPFMVFEERGSLEYQDMRLKKRKGTAELLITVKETTEPGPPAGMGDAEPPETGKAKAKVVLKGQRVDLKCAQRRCLILPK